MTRLNLIRARVYTVAVALLLILLPILSRGIPTPLEDLFADSIEVQVVNVDVVVTDADGQIVTDLTRDDFELFRDGERIEIDYFSTPNITSTTGTTSANSTISNGRPVSESASQAPTTSRSHGGSPAGDLPTDFEHFPNKQDEQSAAPARQREPLLVVLYLDQNHLSPTNRARVLPAVRDFIETQLQPADPAMLVVFNRSLRIAQPFTHDRAQLLDAVEAASREVTIQMLMNSEATRLESEAAFSGRAGGQSAPNFASPLAEDGEYHTYQSLKGLEGFVAQLAGLPYRKAIVHISNGIRPVEQLGTSLRNTTHMANASRITFYTIDARGGNRSAVSAERIGPGGPIGNGNLERPLSYLAEATGGFALLRSQRFGDAFGRIATDLHAQYSLGFTLQGSDEAYHQIEVQVKRRGVDVRHREGFVARSQRSRLVHTTLASLSFAPPSNAMGLELLRGPENAAGELLVRLPLDQLTLLQRDQMLSGQVDLIVAVRADGKLTPLRQIRLPLHIPQATRNNMPSYIAYKLNVPIFDQNLTVAVGARDQYASEASFATLHLSAED